MDTLIIRPVEPRDNEALACLIRQVLTEFNGNKPGTAFFDKTLDSLSDVFTVKGSAYWVVEENGALVGGGGIYPTENLPDGYCELVKLYLHDGARGQGIGKKLLATCFSAARMEGYTHMYLESMPELSAAVAVYKKAGFTFLSKQLGNSGHYNCSIWMAREL